MYTTFCNFLCITVWHIYNKYNQTVVSIHTGFLTYMHEQKIDVKKKRGGAIRGTIGYPVHKYLCTGSIISQCYNIRTCALQQYTASFIGTIHTSLFCNNNPNIWIAAIIWGPVGVIYFWLFKYKKQHTANFYKEQQWLKIFFIGHLRMPVLPVDICNATITPVDVYYSNNPWRPALQY